MWGIKCTACEAKDAEIARLWDIVHKLTDKPLPKPLPKPPQSPQDALNPALQPRLPKTQQVPSYVKSLYMDGHLDKGDE